MHPRRPSLLVSALLAIGSITSSGTHAAELYREPWRPQFHFTPERNWMNDPNGMVYHRGEFHLFYQYNPFGDKWGHMSWGHSVSRDLTHWEPLPLALAEENGVMIFSGSAVVDHGNTSGFGTRREPPMVALYTGHHTTRPLQNQHLAYSTDLGRTWTKYAGNPVLDLGKADFRDPKVSWHPASSQWVMAVSLPVERQIAFYTSPNLKEWRRTGTFGPAGSIKGIWECPDLFPVLVEGSRRTSKWVLIVNVGSGAPAGGSGCQYFVGEFDGQTFRPDPRSQPVTGPASNPSAEPALWADWSTDFYAAVSWSDVPQRDGRRLWLGWMSNWEYAQDVPTSPWRSAMTVPRMLTLRETPSGYRLLQQPVRELESLRTTSSRLRRASLAEATTWLSGLGDPGALVDLTAEFEGLKSDTSLSLRLHTGPGESTLLQCDVARGRLIVDRTRSGRTEFHAKFPAVHEAPVRIVEGRLRLRLLLDTSSVEVFAQDGETVTSTLVFPTGGDRRFELSATGTAPTLKRLELHRLRSAVGR
ncbi:MAG: glycoside hydrolase family 32 protein [Verrucomicrobiales bacterium]|nr:glycoside hydrolase family 32 protein [Verrucomicrobiales bacterium]